MEIIDLARIAQQAWKNGAGLTRVLACGQQGGAASIGNQVTIDDPHWRISLADLHADGPFSVYPGIDRHAVLLSDISVMLFSAHETIHAAPLHVIHYAGETSLTARCASYATSPQFLNLMIKRQTCTSTMDVITSAASLTQATHCFVMPITGAWSVNTGKETKLIKPSQAALCTIEACGGSIAAMTPGDQAIVITLN